MYLPSADKENQENHLKSKTSSGGGGVPLGGVVVAGALTVGAGIVKLVQRHLVLSSQLETTQSELRHTTSQLSELSDQLDYTKEELTQAQSELETSVTMLEQRTKELAEERFALEAARGELGLTQSRIGMIERELKSTKRRAKRIEYSFIYLNKSKIQNGIINAPVLSLSLFLFAGTCLRMRVYWIRHVWI